MALSESAVSIRSRIESELAAIHGLAGRLETAPIRFMEVCGTHTMSIHRHGIPSLLPNKIELISGPGCPVCVTPTGIMDALYELAIKPDVILATFGDMLKVPGTRGTLESARAQGADVRVVYSSIDALTLAQETPGREVAFAGVGFETTAPTMAATLLAARESQADNFSVVAAYKTIPEPMRALLESGEVHLHGFLCPGHVSVILGSQAYEFIPVEFGIPCVVAGFEALDILKSIRMLLEQLSEGRAEVEIEYGACVKREGNRTAQALMAEVFDPCDTAWRGLGQIPHSGLCLNEEFSDYDSLKRFDITIPEVSDPAGCQCGDVLRGVKTPEDCALFGRVCTPVRPVGPCMVSTEGTCAAHFKYGGDRHAHWNVI